MMQNIELFIQTKILPEYQPIVKKFRKLIKEKFPNIKEEMRGGTEKYHGIPVYRFNKIIISVSPTKKGITFSFTEGKKFKDKYSLLEGVGNKTLNLRISDAKNFNSQVFEYYIKQAIKFDIQKTNL